MVKKIFGAMLLVSAVAFAPATASARYTGRHHHYQSVIRIPAAPWAARNQQMPFFRLAFCECCSVKNCSHFCCKLTAAPKRSHFSAIAMSSSGKCER